MALKLKVDALVAELGTNKDYYCFKVPEEYHRWSLKNQWNSMKKEYDVDLMSIKVRESESTGKSSSLSHPKKNPRRLDCVIEVVGKEKVTGTRIYIWKFRVDGTTEANEVLTELCNKDNVDSFDIKELEVYNRKKGAILHCEKHNPDSNMESLYIVGFSVDNKQKLYPEVALGTQQEYIGDFQDDTAHCCQVEGLVKACALKKQVKKTQIKIRKKSTAPLA